MKSESNKSTANSKPSEVFLIILTSIFKVKNIYLERCELDLMIKERQFHRPLAAWGTCCDF